MNIKTSILFKWAYPRIMQLSVKKNSGASGVKISRLRNGTAPSVMARICKTYSILQSKSIPLVCQHDTGLLTIIPVN